MPGNAAKSGVVALVFVLAGVSCNLSTSSPCGRNAYAYGRLTLPDTGINAGTIITFSFLQRDPDLIPERTDLALFQLWDGFVAGGVVPLIRLVQANGEILLEQRATRSHPSEPWRMIHESHDAAFRLALFQSLSTFSLSLQLLESGGDLPGTVLRLEPEEQGVYPPLTCV